MSQFSFNDLEERMSRLGDDISEFVGKVIPDANRKSGFQPAFDVFMDDDAMTFVADLPGFSREDVKIVLRERVITISGERQPDLPESGEMLKSERTFGRFSRSFSVPEGVKSSDIKASFSKGILNITVKLAELHEQSEEIEIE